RWTDSNREGAFDSWGWLRQYVPQGIRQGGAHAPLTSRETSREVPAARSAAATSCSIPEQHSSGAPPPTSPTPHLHHSRIVPRGTIGSSVLRCTDQTSQVVTREGAYGSGGQAANLSGPPHPLTHTS